MKKDKDLEAIKEGKGLSNSTTSATTQSSGIKTDQRGVNIGLRQGLFTRNGKDKKTKP